MKDPNNPEGGSIPIGEKRLGRSAEHTAWLARCPSFAAAETTVGRVAEGDAAGPPSSGRLQEPTTDSQLRFQVPAMVHGKEKVKRRHPYLLELRNFCWHPWVSLSVAVTVKHTEYTALFVRLCLLCQLVIGVKAIAGFFFWLKTQYRRRLLLHAHKLIIYEGMYAHTLSYKHLWMITNVSLSMDMSPTTRKIMFRWIDPTMGSACMEKNGSSMWFPLAR
jgi:hypothetical protein